MIGESIQLGSLANLVALQAIREAVAERVEGG